MKYIKKYNESISNNELIEKLNIGHSDFSQLLDDNNIVEFNDRDKQIIRDIINKIIYDFDFRWDNVAFTPNSPRHPRLWVRVNPPHYSGINIFCFKDDDDYFWVNFRCEEVIKMELHSSYYKIDTLEGLVIFLNFWLGKHMPTDEDIDKAKNRILEFLKTAKKADIYKIDDFIINDIND
jgi:hypothetical protein